MEGRIKLSPVLSAPPTKESDPFCTSATLLPLRPAGETHFKKENFRCILTLLAPVATLLPTEPSPSPNVRFRPATFPRELRIWAWMSTAFFSCFRRAASKALCALATARCRRSRSFCWAASSFARSARPGCVTRCSVRPILEVPRYPPFPCSPLMAFRTTDTVFGHPNAANIWNGRFAP